MRCKEIWNKLSAKDKVDNLQRYGKKRGPSRERIKTEPVSIPALFAEQLYDLVEHDCHFTPPSLGLQDWKSLGANTV